MDYLPYYLLYHLGHNHIKGFQFFVLFFHHFYQIQVLQDLLAFQACYQVLLDSYQNPTHFIWILQFFSLSLPILISLLLVLRRSLLPPLVATSLLLVLRRSLLLPLVETSLLLVLRRSLLLPLVATSLLLVLQQSLLPPLVATSLH